MSLTTVAGPVTPDPLLLQLPPSRPERFQRSDFAAAALVFLVTLGVYLITLSPSVTLEDSGELITGAVAFGVPHPPGYPLWTLSGFLISHLVPFGNMAWRINLESALFGAAANAVLTLLVCHSGRWLLQRWTDAAAQPLVRHFPFYAGLLSGFALGFSDIMWSQSVIAEVYSLNALFVNLVLLLFYFWMLDPQKTQRLVLTVFVFSLGLTNHHTLIQIIPAILLAAILVRAGKFWSVFIAVNLFSLSVLVYLSWLSGDRELDLISFRMAAVIFVLVGLVSFFYLREFRLRAFLMGAALALACFAYGNYFMGPSDTDLARFGWSSGHFWQWGSLVTPGWLQINTFSGLVLLLLAAGTMGIFFTSILDRRLVLGVFAAGWVGLVPYSYEHFASSTNPPMNWGFASERSGFYYAVTRQQYPMSLPNLIKSKVGKLVLVDTHGVQDIALNRPNYLHRLWLTFYYYGDNLQDNFTVPLIFLTLAILLYLWRCDTPQVSWFLFLGVAFFTLGFMLHLISPPDTFDFQSDIQYKVFHLQSHCIFVLLLGYGALAAMTYLCELVPQAVTRFGPLGIGMPFLYLALLPLWSNFDDGSQAGHWFGYDFGTDVMRPMEKNAVYFGGSDFGRFVPTYMAFIESQQNPRWKRDPSFDRRDIVVITQAALCDIYYTKYIRNQYDPRFRPAAGQYTPFEKWLGRDQAYPEPPFACMSDAELTSCWNEFQTLNADRIKASGSIIRPGTGDVFELNGIVAHRLFDKNKATHAFYLEQSIAMEWMYPYLVPSGLIFKLNPEPLQALPPEALAADRRFWDAYAARLLNDPHFRIDDSATISFAKLAAWHADLYRWRNLEPEEEYWLKLALVLCPQLQDAVNSLSRLYSKQKRFDDATALVRQAQRDDPRNEYYDTILNWVAQDRIWDERETTLRADLLKSPYDIQGNLQLARLLQDEGKLSEVNDRLRFVAGLSNWSHDAISDVVQYYVETAHNPDAAIAFLEVRAKIDPRESQLVYSLAALHASVNHRDPALKYLAQSAAVGGSNALISAQVDPRFASLHDDPAYQDLLRRYTATNVPSTDTNTAPPLASPAVHFKK